MAESIRDQGHEYFGFLIMGMVAFLFVSGAVTALPSAVGSAIRTGTLEAMFSTPASLASLLVGFVVYPFSWIGVRASVLVVGAWTLGADIAWSHLPTAAAILALIILSHVPFGLLAAAAILAFRTAGPLGTIVLTLSGLLGGVYYPTHVIPSWIESLSAALPLTYGLRALRRVLLDGASLGAVTSDLLICSAYGVILFGVATLVFTTSLRYARRSGTLAQY
jgi:ABC-2 type transport system permease protein